MNHNVNNWYAGCMIYNPCKRVVWPQKRAPKDHRLRTTDLDDTNSSHKYNFLEITSHSILSFFTYENSLGYIKCPQENMNKLMVFCIIIN